MGRRNHFDQNFTALRRLVEEFERKASVFPVCADIAESILDSMISLDQKKADMAIAEPILWDMHMQFECYFSDGDTFPSEVSDLHRKVNAEICFLLDASYDTLRSSRTVSRSATSSPDLLAGSSLYLCGWPTVRVRPTPEAEALGVVGWFGQVCDYWMPSEDRVMRGMKLREVVEANVVEVRFDEQRCKHWLGRDSLELYGRTIELRRQSLWDSLNASLG